MQKTNRHLGGLGHMLRPGLKTDAEWNAHIDAFVAVLETKRVEVTPEPEPVVEEPAPPKPKKRGKTREHTGGEVREGEGE